MRAQSRIVLVCIWLWFCAQFLGGALQVFLRKFYDGRSLFLEFVLGVAGAQLVLALAVFSLTKSKTKSDDVRDDVQTVESSLPHILHCALWAMFGFLGLSLAMDGLLAVTGLKAWSHLPQTENMIYTLGTSKRLALALFVAVVPGCVEEFFFRGRLFEAFARTTPKASTVILWTSVIFAFFHFDWAHSPVTFVMGLYLGWLRWRLQRLWPGVLTHVVNNFVAVMWGSLFAVQLGAWLSVLLGTMLSLLAIVRIQRFTLKPTCPV